MIILRCAKSNSRGIKINDRFQKSFMIELLLSASLNEQKMWDLPKGANSRLEVMEVENFSGHPFENNYFLL